MGGCGSGGRRGNTGTKVIAAMRGKAQVRTQWEQVMEWEQRRERAELVREHGRQSQGAEQQWAAVQQQQERKPAKTNEEYYRQLYEELSKEISQPTPNEEFFRKIADDRIKQSWGQQQPEQERQRDRGPTRDYGPSR